MKNLIMKFEHLLALSVALLALGVGEAGATVEGISGPSFNLTAKTDYISTADGQSILAWGYGAGTGTMQYPGPTLIVNQGQNVSVTLTNPATASGGVPMPVSIVFPGQVGVAASGGTQGELTREAAPGAAVTYTFTAGEPGTYMYHSGTRPDLQVEMGLVGALIVRPSGGATNQAYGHADSSYNHEYLFLLTEMDPGIHDQVAAAVAAGVSLDTVDTSNYHAVLWFLNGRNAPDTVADNYLPWMQTQPYNCLPRAHPGEKVLLRIIGGGRDLHPFHTHGNNTLLIARDGRLLSSAAGAGADIATSDYTITVAPGSTYDALFEWTGKGLGWDIYGHQAGDPMEPNEYAADHGKAFPVTLPNQFDLTNGPYWSGSPFLGSAGTLPPGEGGFNQNAGYFFMWHSHTEKELTNHNIFPGGMMTMFIVEPAGVTIP